MHHRLPPVALTAAVYQTVCWRADRVFHADLFHRSSIAIRQLVLLDRFHVLPGPRPAVAAVAN